MSNSSGFVLLLVLILSAIMFLIASTLLVITMTEVHISDFEQRSAQALYVAESSLTLGLSKLRENPAYRTATSDTMSIGNNTGLLNVQFYNQSKSLYHLKLRGEGKVPGLNAVAKRTVERQVVVKPFALFARENLDLIGGCTINGNIHGNGTVTISLASKVQGDVTSSTLVNNAGTVTGTVSSQEPEITLPTLPIVFYPPTYAYNGKTGTAKPLEHDTITLSPVGGVDPPVPSIEVYSGFPTADNPAGIFYPEDELKGPWTVLDVTGTVIVPSAGMSLSIDGIVTILPVSDDEFKQFPALMTAGSLHLTLRDNDLQKWAKSLKKSRIERAVYAQGDLTITGNDTTGEIIKGSLLGHTITLTGNPVFQLAYDSTIMSNPPPGIDLIEAGEWRELFGQMN
jgi:hypothetical protein